MLLCSTFIEDPDFVRPVKITRITAPAAPETKPPATNLPWQARHWTEFQALIVSVLDRFPQCADVFTKEMHSLHARLCPQPVPA